MVHLYQITQVENQEPKVYLTCSDWQIKHLLEDLCPSDSFWVFQRLFMIFSSHTD